MTKTATISRCERYRYDLTREWEGKIRPEYLLRWCLFIMLNPSIADANINDPTINRCIGFATSWGYRRLAVVNLFARRTTDPAGLFKAKNPVGVRNDWYIEKWVQKAHLVVCAWGADASIEIGNRESYVINMIRPLKQLHFLRLTAGRHPWHPLYLPGDLKPIAWS